LKPAPSNRRRCTLSIRLSDRELATVLAALRYFQQDLATNDDPPISEHFEEVTPLTPDEIDDLCEKINRTEPGTPIGSYALDARNMNRRQLLCSLRNARKRVKHHHGGSSAGKEAKKLIEAVRDELKQRGMEIPPEGQETAEWDRKAT